MGFGKLVICPTPLGNLGDMTERALQALRAADVVCAEDTRVTGRLLAAFGLEIGSNVWTRRSSATARRRL